MSNIIVNAHYIRHTLRSQMPIEVFYYGDQEMPHALARCVRADRCIVGPPPQT